MMFYFGLHYTNFTVALSALSVLDKVIPDCRHRPGREPRNAREEDPTGRHLRRKSCGLAPPSQSARHRDQ